MKKLKTCKVENCIPTPSSCVEWNGGDIPFLGICNGDSLNTLILEVVKKLEDIAEDDLAGFDIDSLLDICNAKAPQEVTLLSILNVVKNNQICLKDYLDNVAAQIAEMFKDSKVNVNLRCFADFDNLGNALSINREQLDELVIRNLCTQKTQIQTLEGKVVNLQSQIDVLGNKELTVNEQSLVTCVDPVLKPTSSQLKSVAIAHCNLENATGSPAEISSALSYIPADWAAKYATVTGWIAAPTSIADVVTNMLLVIKAQGESIQFMQDTCCAVSCDDIKVGFSAIFNEDSTGLILKFTSGAGTILPAGYTDKGSVGIIKDGNGNIQTFALTIANNAEIEVDATGLDTRTELTIQVTSKIGDGTLLCEKVVSKSVKTAGCGVCELSADGVEGSSVVIIYESDVVGYTELSNETPAT